MEKMLAKDLGEAQDFIVSQNSRDYSPQAFQQKEDFTCFEEEGKK